MEDDHEEEMLEQQRKTLDGIVRAYAALELSGFPTDREQRENLRQRLNKIDGWLLKFWKRNWSENAQNNLANELRDAYDLRDKVKDRLTALTKSYTVYIIRQNFQNMDNKEIVYLASQVETDFDLRLFIDVMRENIKESDQYLTVTAMFGALRSIHVLSQSRDQLICSNLRKVFFHQIKPPLATIIPMFPLEDRTAASFAFDLLKMVTEKFETAPDFLHYWNALMSSENQDSVVISDLRNLIKSSRKIFPDSMRFIYEEEEESESAKKGSAMVFDKCDAMMKDMVLQEPPEGPPFNTGWIDSLPLDLRSQFFVNGLGHGKFWMKFANAIGHSKFRTCEDLNGKLTRRQIQYALKVLEICKAASFSEKQKEILDSSYIAFQSVEPAFEVQHDDHKHHKESKLAAPDDSSEIEAGSSQERFMMPPGIRLGGTRAPNYSEDEKRMRSDKIKPESRAVREKAPKRRENSESEFDYSEHRYDSRQKKKERRDASESDDYDLVRSSRRREKVKGDSREYRKSRRDPDSESEESYYERRIRRKEAAKQERRREEETLNSRIARKKREESSDEEDFYQPRRIRAPAEDFDSSPRKGRREVYQVEVPIISHRKVTDRANLHSEDEEEPEEVKIYKKKIEQQRLRKKHSQAKKHRGDVSETGSSEDSEVYKAVKKPSVRAVTKHEDRIAEDVVEKKPSAMPKDLEVETKKSRRKPKRESSSLDESDTSESQISVRKSKSKSKPKPAKEEFMDKKTNALAQRLLDDVHELVQRQILTEEEAKRQGAIFVRTCRESSSSPRNDLKYLKNFADWVESTVLTKKEFSKNKLPKIRQKVIDSMVKMRIETFE